jgi:hypothetical protein
MDDDAAAAAGGAVTEHLIAVNARRRQAPPAAAAAAAADHYLARARTAQCRCQLGAALKAEDGFDLAMEGKPAAIPC